MLQRIEASKEVSEEDLGRQDKKIQYLLFL
jgi:hypothetical protein